MSKTQVTTLDTAKLATIAVNLLNQTLLEAERTQAKRVFRELEAGRRVGLTNLRMEDGGVVRFDIELDATEFRGSLNFSAFRDGIQALLARLVEELRLDGPLPYFVPLDNTGSRPDGSLRLFGAGGFTVHDEVVNALLLGAEPDAREPVVTLKLVYIDPEQFAQASAADASIS